MIIYDIDSYQVLEVNQAAISYYGYDREEFKALTVGDLRPSEDFENFLKLMPSIKESEVIHVDAKHQLKNGQVRNIEIVSYIINLGGKVCRLAQVYDITDKIKQANNLKILLSIGQSISEKLDLQIILQKVTDATTKLSGAEFGSFFYNTVNEHGEALMLYTLSGAPKAAFEKLGMPRNTSLFHPTFSDARVIRIDDVTKDARYGQNPPHFGMPNGHLEVVSYLSVPVISKSGAVHGCLLFGHHKAGIFTQESEELVLGIASQAATAIDNAKLYEDVKELNAKKDDFITVASHELKTPLTSIKASLEIISRIYKADPLSVQIPRLLSTSNVNVGKLGNLIKDLLNVSKIKGGQLHLNKEWFTMAQIIDDCCQHVRMAGTHELVVEGDLNAKVYADPGQIDQVLVNFVNNAVKYSPEGRIVRIKIETIADMVKVSVSDEGIGIPQEKVPYIFERFYRVDSEGNQFSGLGLGLYISSEIISRHKGKIGVESKIGSGSTFWFIIPVN